MASSSNLNESLNKKNYSVTELKPRNNLDTSQNQNTTTSSHNSYYNIPSSYMSNYNYRFINKEPRLTKVNSINNTDAKKQPISSASSSQ